MTVTGVVSDPFRRAIALIEEIERIVPGLAAGELLAVHNALVPVWRSLLPSMFTPEAGPASASRKQSDPLLTLEEAAAFLRRSRSWLYYHWQPLGLGFRDAGRLRFRQHDLDRYINAQRRGR